MNIVILACTIILGLACASGNIVQIFRIFHEINENIYRLSHPWGIDGGGEDGLHGVWLGQDGGAHLAGGQDMWGKLKREKTENKT